MLRALGRWFGAKPDNPPPAPAAEAERGARLARQLLEREGRAGQFGADEVLAALPHVPRPNVPELVANHLGARTLRRPEDLGALGKALTPVERQRVLELLPPALRLELEASPFCGAGALPKAATTASDRRRIAEATALPPNLAPVAERLQIAARVAAVRKGEAGLLADERFAVRSQLKQLTPDQLKSLRELLVERPPHPELKKMRSHPALSGPPTADGVLAILAGAPLGKKLLAGPEHAARVKSTVAMFEQVLDASKRAALTEQLLQSDTAEMMVRRFDMRALALLDAFGVDGLDRFGHSHEGGEVAAGLGPEALLAYQKQHGPERLERAIDAVAAHKRGLLSNEGNDVLAAVGLGKAAELLPVIAKDPERYRALVALVGKPAALEELRRSSAERLEARLADARAKIPAFGHRGVPLHAGASWPASPPASAAAAKFEADLVARLGLAGKPKASWTPAETSRVADAMSAELLRRRPDLAAQLERELAGRRFVSPRYYDELYALGVQNPEHRYSAESFDSWARADQLVKSAAAASAGRPLDPGEFTKLMQAAHRLAGVGMLENLESHMKAGDLGRLRSEAKDHVQLGDGFHSVAPEQAEILDRNPYLTPSRLPRAPDGKPVGRLIVFAPGEKVPELTAELDRFVRENEGRLPPEELAAEVHHRLVSIHPFMDGNGRTSKLMADFVLARAGVKPPLWRKGDVLLHRDTWPDAVREGVRFHADTVARYLRAALAPPS